jgi:hypothetical protein
LQSWKRLTNITWKNSIMPKSKNFIGFDLQGGVVMACEMRGVMTDSGILEHYINGDLRAMVPEEGQADYVTQWPQLAELTGHE